MSIEALKKTAVLAVYFMILCAAATVPFYFESPSLFYKTGLDKMLLRTGKILGILAIVMIVVQLVLTMRFRWLEEWFSRKSLYTLHRRSGLVILLLVLVHPVLILGADHFVFFPFEKRYWPEFAGIGLLFLMVIFILTSVWYSKIGLTAKVWKAMHLALAPLLIGLAGVHAVNVSRTFESGVPLWGISGLMGLSLMLFMIKLARAVNRHRK